MAKEDDEDSFASLFGSGTSDDEQEGDEKDTVDTSLPGDLTFNFPDVEVVPQELRGKSVADALKMYEDAKKAGREAAEKLEQLTKSLDAAGKASRGNVDDPTEVVVGLAVEGQLKKLIGDDEILNAHMDELLAVAEQISNPKTRVNPDALKLVIQQVRGAHVKEYMELTKRTKPGSVIEGDVVADSGSDRKDGRRQPKLSDEQRKNLGEWFDGDYDAAKANLFGGV